MFTRVWRPGEAKGVEWGSIRGTDCEQVRYTLRRSRVLQRTAGPEAPAQQMGDRMSPRVYVVALAGVLSTSTLAQSNRLPAPPKANAPRSAAAPARDAGTAVSDALTKLRGSQASLTPVATPATLDGSGKGFKSSGRTFDSDRAAADGAPMNRQAAVDAPAVSQKQNMPVVREKISIPSAPAAVTTDRVPSVRTANATSSATGYASAPVVQTGSSVSWGVSVGVSNGWYAPRPYYPPPVYARPVCAPVYCPPPVVYCPPPVYYRPVCWRPPMYCAPAWGYGYPGGVSFSFSFGGGRGCRW